PGPDPQRVGVEVDLALLRGFERVVDPRRIPQAARVAVDAPVEPEHVELVADLVVGPEGLVGGHQPGERVGAVLGVSRRRWDTHGFSVHGSAPHQTTGVTPALKPDAAPTSRTRAPRWRRPVALATLSARGMLAAAVFPNRVVVTTHRSRGMLSISLVRASPGTEAWCGTHRSTVSPGQPSRART